MTIVLAFIIFIKIFWWFHHIKYFLSSHARLFSNIMDWLYSTLIVNWFILFHYNFTTFRTQFTWNHAILYAIFWPCIIDFTDSIDNGWTTHLIKGHFTLSKICLTFTIIIYLTNSSNIATLFIIYYLWKITFTVLYHLILGVILLHPRIITLCVLNYFRIVTGCILLLIYLSIFHERILVYFTNSYF